MFIPIPQKVVNANKVVLNSESSFQLREEITREYREYYENSQQSHSDNANGEVDIKKLFADLFQAFDGTQSLPI